MRELKQRARARALALALCLTLALGSPALRTIGALPDRISLAAGSSAALDVAPPGSATLEAGNTQAALSEDGGGYRLSAGEESGTANLILRLLGIAPVRTVEVEVSEPRVLIPGGKSVGIAIETEGLMVVGTSDLSGGASPARLAGLSAGDVITRVNGEDVRSAEDMAALLRAGEPAALTVVRAGEERALTVTPATDARDGGARIGAWVRSGTAGVGTLTYVDPESGAFGALGHAISDVDTGVTLPVAEGGVYESRVVEVRRGERGSPGEIVGDFIAEAEQIGKIESNCELGVYGSGYQGELDELLYPEGLPVGLRAEAHTGAAQLLTTVDERVRAFDCEIEHIESASAPAARALVLRVTDPELIALTGGIVQGMSGSPIVQDGKLVGAVTHVFVNDPTRGYGIFIENMLEAAG